jgi:hypothetical protein
MSAWGVLLEIPLATEISIALITAPWFSGKPKAHLEWGQASGLPPRLAGWKPAPRHTALHKKFDSTAKKSK